MPHHLHGHKLIGLAGADKPVGLITQNLTHHKMSLLPPPDKSLLPQPAVGTTPPGRTEERLLLITPPRPKILLIFRF